MSSAAYVEPYAYIFGGMNFSDVLDDVIRYDTRGDTLAVMPYTMPEERAGSTAVVFDGAVYIIGGKNETGHTSTPFKFHPSNGTFEELPQLPVPWGGGTSVATDDAIYVFGSGHLTKEQMTMELDPVTGRSRLLDVKVDFSYYWATAVWTGDTALVMGGSDYTSSMDLVREFTPGKDGDGKFEKVATLPKALELATSVFDSKKGKAFLFGGRTGDQGSDKVYVIEKGGEDDGGLSPGRVGAAIGIMAFVIVVVIIQSYLKSGEPPKEEREKESDELEEEL
jgi:N-acetylneuraminic acid mutarotase